MTRITVTKSGKWEILKWPGEDDAEYRTHMVDKATGKPYEATIKFFYRKNGKKDYDAVIQFMSPDEVRGCWYFSTGFYDQGEFTDVKSVIAKVDKALAKLVKNPSRISYEDYFDWEDNHPILKHRRLASDYGIYIVSADRTAKGWFDRRFGTIAQTNKYATRYPSKEAAQEEAAKLAKGNPKFTFSVKQMGKLDD